jgi:calcineurin-like phosphoesterase family protein
MDYWFSSDWHLSHKRMMEILRPEFKTIDEMNTTILDNMFKVTKPGDQMYFAGDLVFTDNNILEQLLKLIKKHRIHFHWITGNHDKKTPRHVKDRVDSFVSVKDIKINKQKITICHFPMISWNCSHYGAWQLFGHHHRKNHGGPTPIVGKQLNINCEFHDFKPWNFEEIKVEIDKLKKGWDYIEKDGNNLQSE